jgi:hypothetical protein
MSWYYKEQYPGEDPNCQFWEVGFYAPSGEFIQIDTYKTEYEAGERVHKLNGGSSAVISHLVRHD